MSGYIANIEDATTKNSDYRRVLFTAKHTQLVLMNLKPERKSEKKYTNWINLSASRPAKVPSFSTARHIESQTGLRSSYLQVRDIMWSTIQRRRILSCIASTVLRNTRIRQFTKLSGKLMPTNIIISMAKHPCERLLGIKKGLQMSG